MMMVAGMIGKHLYHYFVLHYVLVSRVSTMVSSVRFYSIFFFSTTQSILQLFYESCDFAAGVSFLSTVTDKLSLIPKA